jgi:PAS domain S-box-containing protein
MTAPKTNETDRTDLQRRVARIMRKLPASKGPASDEIRRLMQEIMANQSELERQNEELLKNRYAMEAAGKKYEALYRKYVNLFDFAPIGYMIIDEAGKIHEINLAAAVALNAPRGTLVGHGITEFIHRDDQDRFYIQKKNCHKNPEATTFELRIRKTDGFLFDAQIQLQPVLSINASDVRYSIALIDISEQVQLSSSYTFQQNCLELTAQATERHALLKAYVQLVQSYLQCDAVGIRIRDEAGHIPYRVHVGFSRDFCESESLLSLNTDRCLCTMVMKGTVAPDRAYVTDKGSFYTNGTSRFLAMLPSEDMGMTRNVCHVHGYESVALIPIVINDHIEGLVHMADRRENIFPLRMVETLENSSTRLGMALQRLQLQEELRESVKAMHELSGHLLTVQEDEQQRIAMELHDGCGQDMNVLKLRLKAIQNQLPGKATELMAQCGQLLSYTDKIIDNIRNISHGLKPAALETLGLAAAVQGIIREFARHTSVQIETKIDPLDDVTDPKAQVCLFRIFQEALTNIHKHAQATWVLITVTHEGKDILIRIEDNGIGFDMQNQSERTNGNRAMGLSAMALRCRMIGATIDIVSEAGQGTRLTIDLPCPLPRHHAMKN